MDLQIGELLNHIGIKIILVVGLASVAYLVVYLVINKVTKDKELAKLNRRNFLFVYFSLNDILLTAIENSKSVRMFLKVAK